MYIAEYMTENPITISPDAFLPEAREIMSEYRFRHLPVADEKGTLIGIITDRDIRSAFPSTVVQGEQLIASQSVVDRTRVRDIMVTDCVTISPYDTLDDSLLMFDRKRVGALPVIDGDKKILGMFSIRDLTSAYRKLFGMAEKGSVLIAIEDEGQPDCMTKIVTLLEQKQIPLTRIIRMAGDDNHNGRIYMRLNTYNVNKVQKLFKDAGFTLIKPELR